MTTAATPVPWAADVEVSIDLLRDLPMDPWELIAAIYAPKHAATALCAACVLEALHLAGMPSVAQASTSPTEPKP